MRAPLFTRRTFKFCTRLVQNCRHVKNSNDPLEKYNLTKNSTKLVENFPNNSL